MNYQTILTQDSGPLRIEVLFPQMSNFKYDLNQIPLLAFSNKVEVYIILELVK